MKNLMKGISSMCSFVKAIVEYNGNTFKYYAHSRFSGVSIITKKRFPAGSSIYWCTGVGGFLFSEFPGNANVEPIKVEKKQWHTGPVNSEWTYDDSVSRKIVTQVFRKHFGIELYDTEDDYRKVQTNDGYVELKTQEGKYNIDLTGFNETTRKGVCVEVERTKNTFWFDENDTRPFTILVSKFYQYFAKYNENWTGYMAYVNEELGKVLVLQRNTIKSNRGEYRLVPISTPKGVQYKEFYEIEKKKNFQIFDIDTDVNSVLERCTVNYTPGK
jgi:hypothetical protein